MYEILEREKKSFEDIANEMYEYFYTFIKGGDDILLSSIGNEMSVSFTFEKGRYPEIAKKAVETVLVVLPNVTLKIKHL